MLIRNQQKQQFFDDMLAVNKVKTKVSLSVDEITV